MKPILLDLYGGGGGAARGYQQAGWYVRSVDIAPQPDTIADEFVQLDLAQRDARGAVIEGAPIVVPPSLLVGVQAIHTSPPCQASSALTKGTNFGMEYPQLIPGTRSTCLALGLPFVIENVAGAPIRKDLRLCGEMFGLGVIRHRYFEIHGFTVEQPAHVPHRGRVKGYRHGEWFDGPYFQVYGDGGGKGSVEEWRVAMGIDWTSDRKTIAEALPPAYTRLIGEAMYAQVVEEEVA